MRAIGLIKAIKVSGRSHIYVLPYHRRKPVEGFFSHLVIESRNRQRSEPFTLADTVHNFPSESIVLEDPMEVSPPTVPRDGPVQDLVAGRIRRDVSA